MTADDKAYREWIQRQPSCLSGQFSEYLESGEGRCVAAHVRRAATSGTGFKADYSCVPLTHDEHSLQHQRGELFCLAFYLPLDVKRKVFSGVVEKREGEAKAFFDGQVQKYRRLWEAQQ